MRQARSKILERDSMAPMEWRFCEAPLELASGDQGKGPESGARRGERPSIIPEIVRRALPRAGQVCFA